MTLMAVWWGKKESFVGPDEVDSLFVSLGFQGHNSPTLLDRSIKENNIFFALCDFLM